MRALSLFANIGVAEAYLDKIGVEVVLANELIKKKSRFVLRYISKYRDDLWRYY